MTARAAGTRRAAPANVTECTFGYLVQHSVLVCLFVCQVVEKLIRGLAMEDSRNMFALFEHNDTTEKAIESRMVVADVLAKFEK